jgi:hypothetical protein
MNASCITDCDSGWAIPLPLAIDQVPVELYRLVDQLDDPDRKLVCFFDKGRAEMFLRRFVILDTR